MFRTLSLLFILAFSSCLADSGELSPASADSLIRARKADSAFRLVDVRTPEEFASGHLSGASMVDFHAPNFQTEIGKLPREAKILIYCRSGNRSGQTLQLMKSMGFKDATHIAGGINAWKAQGLPVVP